MCGYCGGGASEERDVVRDEVAGKLPPHCAPFTAHSLSLLCSKKSDKSRPQP